MKKSLAIKKLQKQFDDEENEKENFERSIREDKGTDKIESFEEIGFSSLELAIIFQK